MSLPTYPNASHYDFDSPPTGAYRRRHLAQQDTILDDSNGDDHHDVNLELDEDDEEFLGHCGLCGIGNGVPWTRVLAKNVTIWFEMNGRRRRRRRGSRYNADSTGDDASSAASPVTPLKTNSTGGTSCSTTPHSNISKRQRAIDQLTPKGYVSNASYSSDDRSSPARDDHVNHLWKDGFR